MRLGRNRALPLLLLGLVCSQVALGQETAPKRAESAPSLRQVLDRADKLMAEHQYAEARQEYERARSIDSGSVGAWRGLGWSLWQLGEKQQAMQAWNDFLKVLPNEPSILLAIAEAEEQDYQWDRALEDYARVLRVRPKHAGAREARARILSYLADTAAKAASPDQAIAIYKRSLQDRPDHRNTVRALVDLYQTNQRYAEATDLLSRYLATHPGDDEMREKLAIQAGLAGDYDEAEKEWRILLKKHPDDEKHRLSLANLLQRAGRSEASIEVAKEMVDRDPQNAEALELLANDAFFGGRPEEAIQWFERLVAVQPTTKSFDQLGGLHLTLGKKRTDLEDSTGAHREYVAASEAFHRAGELEAMDVDARLGEITALRLQGKVDEAIQLAEQLHEKYPSSLRPTRELYDAYLQKGDYDHAEKYYSAWLQGSPRSFRARREGTFLTYASAGADKAIADIEQLRQEQLRPNIPVLLYHGITTSPTENAMWVENFRDQMRALKKAGYETVTVHDLVDFLDGKDLPQRRPVVITFDDARADSFRNGDPILKELGFRAAMFIPAAEIDRHIPFYATWQTIREMQKTGRWDMQCHAYLAHRLIPIDDKGAKGRFNANLKWLADQGRLETEEEFAARIDKDYRECKEAVTNHVPEAKVVSYAYPFDDLGQNTLTNYPAAYEVNQKLVGRYYSLAFLVAPAEFVRRDTPRTLVSRYEVPREFKGRELLLHLRTDEPEISLLLREADFYAYSGRYDKAIEIYDKLATEDVDRSTLDEGKGRVLAWRGDYAGAHELLKEALILRPDDELLAARVHDLDLQFRPILRMNGGVYSDNRDRTNTRFGPSGQVFLTDRFSLAPSYDRLELSQKHFDFAHFAPGAGQTAGSSSGSLSDVELRTQGNQFQTQLEYDVDWHTNALLSGGVAEFDNRSSPRVLGSSRTFALASGQLNFGLGDRIDASVGGSHDYVPAVGAILKDLAVSSSLARLRVRATESITLFGQHSFSYYDDGNNRNSFSGQLLYQLLSQPQLQVGYQFIYDNVRDNDPFFYTPDRFIANEGLVLLQARAGKRLTAHLAISVGEGSERNGNAELEASANGGLELHLGDHFGLFGNAARSQAARFRSIEGNGGAFLRF